MSISQNAISHHAANAAAIVIPVAAWVTNVEPYLAVALTIAGLGWYGVLFFDRFVRGDRHRD